MRQYYLDSYGEEFSDYTTFLAIKEVIQIKENKNWQNLLLVSDLIRNIKGDDLLNPVLKLVEEAGLLDNRESFEEKLLFACDEKSYPADDLTRIKAIAFADLIAREVYQKLTSGVTSELLVRIHERKILTNINEIENQFKRESYLEFAERNENLEPARREEDYSALLRSMAGLNYEYNTEFFKDEVTYFTTLKENIPAIQKSKTAAINIGKPGRKRSSVKPIEEYFIGYDETTTKKYLNALKEQFKDSSNIEFVFLIKGLKEIGDIQFSTRKEIYLAFEDFFERKHTTSQSKNVHYISKNTELQTEITSSIMRVKEQKFIF